MKLSKLQDQLKLVRGLLGAVADDDICQKPALPALKKAIEMLKQAEKEGLK